MIVQHLRNKVEWMGNLIFSDMFPQSDEWRRLNNMCGSIIYVGTSTSTCFRKRSRLRKSEVAKENNENYLTDEEQHKIIIKDYDMLFEYRE